MYFPICVMNCGGRETRTLVTAALKRAKIAYTYQGENSECAGFRPRWIINIPGNPGNHEFVAAQKRIHDVLEQAYKDGAAIDVYDDN